MVWAACIAVHAVAPHRECHGDEGQRQGQIRERHVVLQLEEAEERHLLITTDVLS